MILMFLLLLLTLKNLFSSFSSSQVLLLNTNLHSSNKPDDGLISEMGETSEAFTELSTKDKATVQLWRCNKENSSILILLDRSTVSLDHLIHQFALDSANKSKYPVLHLFLTEEKKLRALKYL